MIIGSTHNPKIKQTVQLRRASQRRKQGLFLIDGWREIELAHAAGIPLKTVFYATPNESAVPLEHLSKVGIQVTDEVLEKIGYGQRTDSPVAVAQTPELSLERLGAGLGTILVLDRTEKPGNLGACIRSAIATGASAIILTNPICEVFNDNAIRASRGAIFSIPLAVTTPQKLLEWCSRHSRKLHAAIVDAPKSLWDQDLSGITTFLFGNESVGLGDEWPRENPVIPFQIPMAEGAVDSLNLSISAAVTLFEAVRQRSRI